MQKTMEAVGIVLGFLERVPLSASTVKGYRNCYTRIISYCESAEIEAFTDEEAERFVKSQLKRMDGGEFSPQQFRLYRKAATLLSDQVHGRELKQGVRRYNKKKMDRHFEEIFKDFEIFLSHSLSEGTVRITVGVIRQFLLFLGDSEVNDISLVTQEIVNDFLAIAVPKHKSSISNLMLPIKKFLEFLCDMGVLAKNLGQHLINPASRRRKLLPCFTEIEINDILAAVDRSSDMGKRDYAIIKLAVGTGLRNTDIFNLRMLDIDWWNSELNVLQSKTNVFIQLPLQPDVGNAIAEYILDARPQSDSPYVFLRTSKPHEKLSSPQAGRNIITSYIEKANIHHEAWDGKRFHALRRTTGTRLIRAGIPIESVSEMLGQKNVYSAKRYISLNDDELRICCLDISEYATTKEGLI
jgi:site-specific recombinase XerD